MVAEPIRALTAEPTPIRRKQAPILIEGIHATCSCPRCSGHMIIVEFGEPYCLSCGTYLKPVELEAIIAFGREVYILRAVDFHDYKPPRLVQVDHMAESRITRERARDEGTSRVARVLGLIPEPPNAVTARTIARQLCISRMEVDEALADLVGAGQVERRSYNARRGYTGYCRR